MLIASAVPAFGVVLVAPAGERSPGSVAVALAS